MYSVLGHGAAYVFWQPKQIAPQGQTVSLALRMNADITECAHIIWDQSGFGCEEKAWAL